MANSLEFSRFGHPIENRFDGYGEPMEGEGDIPTCFDTWSRPEPRTVSAGEVDDYDPFAQVAGEGDEVTK